MFDKHDETSEVLAGCLPQLDQTDRLTQMDGVGDRPVDPLGSSDGTIPVARLGLEVLGRGGEEEEREKGKIKEGREREGGLEVTHKK